MSGDERDWAIVGGGILGARLALLLSGEGHRVTIYERGPHVGGLAAPFRIGDVTWDRFYHVALLSDTTLRSFLTQLGLEQDMRWVPTGTGLYDDGNLWPVSSAADYLRLPALGPIAKARIGATVLWASRIKNWRRLEDITAEQWLSRWSGPRAYETFWLPLLRSKLGDRSAEASAAFIWAIIDRLYAARRAGMKQDLFGYLPGGYARILDRLRTILDEHDVVVRTSSGVHTVTAEDGRVSVATDDGSHRHDTVVVTTPSPIATRLLPQLSDAERAAHEAIVYQGIICVSLLIDRPLSAYYVTNITDLDIPFTGVIEMTALVDPAEFGGSTLIYLPKYIAPDDDLFDASDDEVVSRFIAALTRMHPNFTTSNIIASEVSRARYVLPVNTLGYSTHLPSTATNVPGVHIVNTAHIVNGTLNVDETLQLADRVLPALLNTPVPEPRA